MAEALLTYRYPSTERNHDGYVVPRASGDNLVTIWYMFEGSISGRTCSKDRSGSRKWLANFKKVDGESPSKSRRCADFEKDDLLSLLAKKDKNRASFCSVQVDLASRISAE
jgi:hypothetical protein